LDHDSGVGFTLLAGAGIGISGTGDKTSETPTTSLPDEVAAKVDWSGLHAIGCEHASGSGLVVRHHQGHIEAGRVITTYSSGRRTIRPASRQIPKCHLNRPRIACFPDQTPMTL